MELSLINRNNDKITKILSVETLKNESTQTHNLNFILIFLCIELIQEWLLSPSCPYLSSLHTVGVSQLKRR